MRCKSSTRTSTCAAAIALALTCLGSTAALGEVVEIMDRRELFVDRFLIDELAGATLKLHTPLPAPEAERPIPVGGTYGNYVYGTVFQDGDIYRFYGRRDRKNDPQVIVYAQSSDGINWTEPELDLFDVPGISNVIMHGAATYPVHNFTPFLDTRPGVPADQRYKGVGGAHVKEGAARGQGTANIESFPGGLRAYVSADGIRWRLLQDEPVIPNEWGLYDSQNLAFWSELEGCYVCYFRVFDNVHSPGVRSVRRSTSTDFVNWTPPVDVRFNLPRPGGPNRYTHRFEQIYVKNIKPYFRAPHIYVGLPTRINFDRNAPGEVLLTTSRDGVSFDRTFDDVFLRPGAQGSYGNRGHYLSNHVIQTGPTVLSLYSYQPYRWTLRLDGFASLHGPFAGGEATTRPLRFRGNRLELNVQTAGIGHVKIELQDESGTPIPGYTEADAIPFRGDNVAHLVQWRDGGDVGDLAGRPVRMRLILKDADVFAFRFLTEDAP